MAKRTYYVYILSNESRMLYTGVTNNLERRVYEHKKKLVPGFTKQYNLHQLVHFEMFGEIRAAIGREKEIKGWLRAKKMALITAANPKWRDLASEWFKPSSSTQDKTYDTRASNTTASRSVSS